MGPRLDRTSAGGRDDLSEDLGRRPPVEGAPRPTVELARNGVEVRLVMTREIVTAREVLTEEVVGVLVRRALPGAARIAEEDPHAAVDADGPCCWRRTTRLTVLSATPHSAAAARKLPSSRNAARMSKRSLGDFN